jgi:hypothetical protein
MQIILSKEEVLIIHEALITEIRELTQEKLLSERKGRGEFEAKELIKIEALRKRMEPYVE